MEQRLWTTPEASERYMEEGLGQIWSQKWGLEFVSGAPKMWGDPHNTTRLASDSERTTFVNNLGFSDRVEARKPWSLFWRRKHCSLRPRWPADRTRIRLGARSHVSTLPDFTWLYLTLTDSTWLHLAPPDFTWLHLAPHETSSSWVHAFLRKPQWSQVEPNRATWSLILSLIPAGMEEFRGSEPFCFLNDRRN